METLTFLFTDIEGSTMLLQQMGGAGYAGILADHRRLIRAALAAHAGKEIDTAGDGFFAVFSSPSACVATMVETQRALGAHPWPEGRRVRVRMGAHSGEASATAGGLVGLEVHRAARVAAVAHGGQSILSSTTAALVRDSLPVGTSLQDLGFHRLKDLGRPEQIFQVQAEGLDSDFPRLRSLDNPELPNNLPGSLTAFIGREAELAEIRSLVESSRLVTLTGAGGSGKTRLALHVATELLDGSGEGVWFVDLAVIAEPEQVAGAVAAALGIREQAGRPPVGVLLEVLRDQRILIVLDNCEHVVDACATLAELVERGCPGVHLVVTTREPLGIDGERVYRVRPLSLPSDGANSVGDLEGSDAVALFVERAQSHDSTFRLDDSIAAPVASICRRLDGIPFALELAAARLTSMSLLHLNERLDQRFRLLTGGSRTALPRQRTLQATVDWSFDLLSEREREVLRRLSVFVGGFELEAAEAVCVTPEIEAFEVADLLASLVTKSLVIAERSSGALRYRLLETIRQYATDQFARSIGAADADNARRAHAEYYLNLSERAAPELIGPHQVPWLRRLDLEWDNIREALAFLSAEVDRTEKVLSLGVALFHFLVTRFHLEPISHLRAALEQPALVTPAVRARALYVTSYLMVMSGIDDRLELPTAIDLGERALEMARDLNARRLIVEVLAMLCAAAKMNDESSRATPLGEEALEIARSFGDPWLIGEALWSLTWEPSDPDRKRALCIEAIDCYRRAGELASVAAMLDVLVGSESEDGQLEAARGHAEEAVEAAEQVGSTFNLVDAWGRLGWVLLLQGELKEASLVGRKSLIAARRVGLRGDAAFAIFTLTCCAIGTGDYRRGAQLLGAHDVLDADVVARRAAGTYSWTPLEQRMRDDNRERLREVLGDGEFERVYRAGKALNFEDAADLALGRDPFTLRKP